MKDQRPWLPWMAREYGITPSERRLLTVGEYDLMVREYRTIQQQAASAP